MLEVDFMVLTREANTGFLRFSTIGVLGWTGHNTQTSQHSNSVSSLVSGTQGKRGEAFL